MQLTINNPTTKLFSCCCPFYLFVFYYGFLNLKISTSKLETKLNNIFTNILINYIHLFYFTMSNIQIMIYACDRPCLALSLLIPTGESRSVEMADWSGTTPGCSNHKSCKTWFRNQFFCISLPINEDHDFFRHMT